MKRKISIVAALVTVTGLSAAAMFGRRGNDAPSVATGVVSRGSIVAAVSATGTLEAVDTVQVGSQVSGTIQSLNADFNSIVRKGQVLARLDPSFIQADIERAKANLLGAEADVERLKVQLSDAEVKLGRARELEARQLIARTDLEAAEIAQRTFQAQVKAASAQVTQAQAALAEAQVNLQKTVITSPIDGIVISRSVELGQTVAASLQAPTLFTIAADLGRMQLKASIDESDLGNIKDGQPVTFRVDAYPTDVFHGRVEQVRLNPVIEQNVVTYAAIVSAPNAELKLKPGMTATLTVEVTRRDNVLRVPNAALRFKPTNAVLAAFGQATTDALSSARPTGTTGKPAAPTNKGTVWVSDTDQLRAVPVTIGPSDGTLTEVAADDLPEGTKVTTLVTLKGSESATRATAGSSNPLMGPSPPRR
jgi:HlyD family secretion protein